MSTAHNFTSPVGRLVGGDVFKPRTKDFDGRPLMTRNNEPRVEYVVQIAFPKSDPDTEQMRAKIYQAAAEGFPTLFPGGQCSLPSFSFKWVDGDSTTPNQRGTIPSTKEGYAGHWVLTFKSAFAPQVFGQKQEPIADPSAIKRGDYVRVGVSCRGNESQSKPGVYLNHSMLQLCGYGEAISTGPDAAVVFAEDYHLPPGASATPVAPSAVPGASPPAPPAGIPTPAAVPAPAAPAGAPAPVPFGAPSAVPPAPPPPAAARQMAPGCPFTYEALVAQGWSDEQMRAAGHLA